MGAGAEALVVDVGEEGRDVVVEEFFVDGPGGAWIMNNGIVVGGDGECNKEALSPSPPNLHTWPAPMQSTSDPVVAVFIL